MPTVQFTSNLKRFYPLLKPMKVGGATIASVLDEVNEAHPGIRDYIVDENGTLRQHVHIFIGNEMIKDRNDLMDQLGETDDVYIMQALSGG